MQLLHDLHDGKKREIRQENYYAFLIARPVAAFLFPWNGELKDFGFAEGDYIYGFKIEGGNYYARKTNLLNPVMCGVSVKEQLTNRHRSH
jgi:hypothetical protein